MKRKSSVFPANYKTNYFHRWYIANSLYSFGPAEKKKNLYLIIGGERGRLNASLHFGLGQESYVITEVLKTHHNSVSENVTILLQQAYEIVLQPCRDRVLNSVLN